MTKNNAIGAIIVGIGLIVSGCGTTTPDAYSYSPGLPSQEVRNAEWEGFGSPANSTKSERAMRSDLNGNPKVLWIIADTYGNPNEMRKEWIEKVPWFFDSERLRFVEPEGSPNEPQHWHGFGCYSRGWPLLYMMPNVDVVLFRMIDVTNGEDLLLDFIDEELIKYKGRVIVSNSWGIPRQNSSSDNFLAAVWQPWANRIDQMAVDYPNFTAVFSSGNSGPEFSGFPQSLMTNAVLVGATGKSGYVASFSSQDNRMFCVAGGLDTYVADHQSGKYMVVSGTSFSCPTVAAMIVKLLAENPDWDRKAALDFLKGQIVQSPEANGYNGVWGNGELEQFNQTVPHNVWRDVGYPIGWGAMIKNLVTPRRIIDLPQPLPRTQ